MKKQTAKLVTEFYTLTFRFENLMNEEMLLVYYKYEGKESEYRARSRKIYTDKNGMYFTHNRQKVRIDNE